MWRILKEKHNLTAKRYVIYIFCYELVLPSSMGFESLLLINIKEYSANALGHSGLRRCC